MLKTYPELKVVYEGKAAIDRVDRRQHCHPTKADRTQDGGNTGNGRTIGQGRNSHGGGVAPMILLSTRSASAIRKQAIVMGSRRQGQKATHQSRSRSSLPLPNVLAGISVAMACGFPNPWSMTGTHRHECHLQRLVMIRQDLNYAVNPEYSHVAKL